MKLNGYDPMVYGSMNYDRKTNTYKLSSSFLERMQKAQEAKKASSINQVRDTFSCSAVDLQIYYIQLSPESQNVLERINAETGDIGKEEWNDLCKELRDLGALTDEDLLFTRSDLRLIPVGYTDSNGNFMEYKPSFLAEHFLEKCGTHQSGHTLWDLAHLNDWDGDPLKYLDDWTNALSEWRKVLAQQRAADGSPAYDNYGGIDREVEAGRKVSDLVRNLSKLAVPEEV